MKRSGFDPLGGVPNAGFSYSGRRHGRGVIEYKIPVGKNGSGSTSGPIIKKYDGEWVHDKKEGNGT